MTGAPRIYRRDFGLAMALYAVAVIGAPTIIRHFGLERPLDVIVALLPVLPVLLALRAIITFSRSWDELQRRIASEAMLVSGLVVGMGSFAWGFIETLPGLPHLPAIWILPSILAIYGLARTVIARRYR